MNKQILISFFVLFILAAPEFARATHCAGGEISYEWVSDSTYRVYFKLYRDCSGVAAPGNNSIQLCYTNSCNFFTGTTYMNLIAKLPDSTVNGSPVSTGCAGVGTKCSSSSSAIPGYQEWWYKATVTLPYRCNYWTFCVSTGGRNPSANLVNAGSANLYVEATLNNLTAQGNSSPYFSVKPVPSVCLNQWYTYNNGGVDPNSDSLVFEMARPLNSPGGCPQTTSNIAFASGSPSYNTTNNPIQTNNTFVLDTITGQMTFKPGLTGAATLTTRIKEYRNGVLIGTVMRDIQVQVIACTVPGPIVNTVSSTITGATYVNGRVEACAGVPMSFCYDMKSTNTSAKLVASDNHAASAPGSSVSYAGQQSDSIRGCFSWTPGTLDTGLRVYTVTVKDSTCNSPGVIISQTFVLPIYIWPITDIIKDTVICYGDTVQLTAVGGASFSWSVLSGGAPISSLSCNTCKQPFAYPLLTTSYVVSNSATQYCSKNKDTAVVTVTDIRYDTLQATSNSPICEGDTLKLFSSSAPSGNGYKWTGPGGYSSTLQNPTRVNASTTAAGSYILKSSKGNCLSFPDTTAVVVNARAAKPTAGNNGPLCAGSTLNLTSTTVSNATYIWSGPGSFSSTLQNPSITNIDTTKAGSYRVIAISTINGCPSLPDSTTVVVTNIPVIGGVTYTHPSTCGGSQGSITLSGLKASTSYTLNYKKNGIAQTPVAKVADGTGSILLSGLDAATYSQIKVTLVNCVSDTTNVIVLANPKAPVVTAGNNTPICAGDSLKIFAGADSTGVTWSWTGPLSYSSNIQNPVIANAVPAQSGSYVVSATKNNCTSATDTTIVVVHATPATPVAGNNGPICHGDTLYLSSSGISGVTYDWTGPNSFTSVSQNPVLPNADTTASGNYIVKATANGCPSLPDTTTVLVKAVPEIPTANSNTPICQGDTLRLFADTVAGAAYSWTGPLSYSSNNQDPVIPNAVPAESGDYTVKALMNGCYSLPDTTHVVIHATPATPVAANNGPLCTGNTLQLTATADSLATYSWTGPNSFTATNQNPSIVNVQTGMAGAYTVTATLNSCISNSDSTTVVINALPAPVIGGSSVIYPSTCGGNDGSIILTGLTASASYIIHYNKNTVAQSPASISANGSGVLVIGNLAAGSYTQITVTAASGCTSVPIPGIVLNDPTPPVISLSSTLNPSTCSGADGYIKIGGLVYNSTYAVNYTRNAIAQSPLNLVANSSGIVTIQGLTAGLYGNISVTIINCTSNVIDSILLADPNAPVVQATNNTPVCEGDTVKLFGVSDSSGVSWSWTGLLGYNSGNQNPVISNAASAQAGAYVLTATKNNCTSQPDTTTITVHATPVTPVAGNNGPICSGSTIQLTATSVSGATYSWTGPLSYTADRRNNDILNADTFMSGWYVIKIAVNNCPSIPDSTHVIVYQVPTIDSTAFTHPTTCGGTEGTITLYGLKRNTIYAIDFRKNSVAQSTQHISTNPSGQLLVTGLGAGSYSDITVTLNNCTSYPTENISLKDPAAPVVQATNNAPVCQGDTLKLYGLSDSTGVNWSWTGPLGYTSNNQNPVIANGVPAQSGVYTLTATKNNCVSTGDSTTVIIYPTPATPVASNNSPICSGSTLQLTSTTVGSATYSWTGPQSFSASVQNPSISNADTPNTGNYVVIATENNCPSLPDTTVVIVYDVPLIGGSTHANPTTCGGTEGWIRLTGLKVNTSYSVDFKKNGITQATQSISTNSIGQLSVSNLGAGSYTALQVTLHNCTSDTLAGILLKDPNAPVVQATNNTPVCQGDTVKLYGLSDSAGVNWSWTGPLGYTSTNQNPVIANGVPAQSGVYILIASKNNCVSSGDSTSVTVYPTPATPVANNNSPICSGSTLQLTSTTVGSATYSWTGSQSFSASVQNPSISNADTPNTGNYVVIATENNCPSLPDTTVVIVYDVPLIGGSTHANPTTCGGTEGWIVLTGLKINTVYNVDFKKNSIAQSTQSISTNSTGQLPVTGLGAGVYSNLRVTLHNCTSDTLAGIVLTDPNAPVVQATNNTPICQGDTVRLYGLSDSASVSWSWSGPLGYTSTNQNPVIANGVPAQSGVYTLIATKNNCVSTADSTTVIVYPTPATPVAGSNSPLCSGNSINLAASTVTGATYSWTGPLSFSSNAQNPVIPNAQPATSGQYIVNCTINGCVSLSDTTPVTVYPLPAPIAGTITIIHPTTCNGSDGAIIIEGLNANAVYGVNYKKNGVSQTQVSIAANSSGILTIAGLTAGNYTFVTVTSTNGCTSDPLPTLVLADPVPPVISIVSSVNPTTCLGSNGYIVLGGFANNLNYHVSYYKNSLSQAPVTITSSSSGTVTITGLTRGTYDSFQVEIYNCYSNITGPTILADPNAPVVQATNNTPVCEGDTLRLYGLSDSAGVSWSWSGPLGYTSNSQNPVIANGVPALSGVYTLTASKNNCVSASDTTTVTVYPTPATPVANNNSPLCSGSTLQLTSSTVGSATYSWTGPQSFSASVQNPGISNADTPNTGNYVVIATENNCPSLPDTTVVIVYDVPLTGGVTHANPTTCGGTEGWIRLAGLKINTSYSVDFKKNGITQATQNISTNPAGQLRVSGLGAGSYTGLHVTLHNCTSDTLAGIMLTDPNAPVVQALNNTPVCEGDTVQLYGSSDSATVTWVWSGPSGYTSTAESPLITNAIPTQSGIYVLTASKNNCTSRGDTTIVIIHPTPTTPVAGSNSPLCMGSTLQLTSSTVGGATYSWNGPQSFTSSVQNPVMLNADTLASGNYIVVATINNCPSLPDTTNVIVHHIPSISSYSHTDPSNCGGTDGTITLNGLRNNLVYQVNYKKNGTAQIPLSQSSNSTGTLVINSLGAGLYTGITVTLNNCTSDSLAGIILNDPNAPMADARNNTPICQNDTLKLTGFTDSAGVSWLWSGPSSFSSTNQNPVVANALPSMSGIYTLTVSKNNCISTDTTNVLVHPTPPTPTAGNNGPLCSGNTLQLTSLTISGASYAWTGPNSYTSTSQNPGMVNVDTTRSGKYIVTATVNNCVSKPDTTTVVIYHVPVIASIAYTQPTTCGGTQGSITLAGFVRNASFTVTYRKNGMPQPGVVLSSSSTGVIVINGLNAGLYDSIRVSVFNCTSNIAGPVLLQDPTAPRVFPANSTPICEGGTILLNGRSDSTGVTWSWTGPLLYTSANQNPVIPNALPNRSGYYYLTATKNNCTSVPDSTYVLVSPTPPKPVTGNNGPLCPGNTLNLSSLYIPGATYVWTGPLGFADTTRNPAIPNVQPVHSGLYIVTATVNGCPSLPDTTSVVVNPTPVAPVATPWYYYCEDVVAPPLTATGTSLLWYTAATGGTGSAVAPAPSTTTPGTTAWYVSQTVNGCESGRTLINVTIHPKPQPPSVTPSYEYCQFVPTVPLSANGSLLKWYTTLTGGTASGVIPTPSSAVTGLFKWYVSQTDAKGCESDRDSIEVRINPNVNSDIVLSQDTVCQYDDINVTNNVSITGLQYTWDFDGADVSSGDTSGPYVLSWNDTGMKIIKVAITHSNCGNPDSAKVYVSPIPDATFRADNDGCVLKDMDLNPARNDGAQYIWSLDGGIFTGSEQNKVFRANWSIPGDKVIVLVVISKAGCMSAPYTQLAVIHENPDAAIEFVSSKDVCAGDTITISTNANTPYTYTWSGTHAFLSKTGHISHAIVTERGIVILNARNEWGCEHTDSITVAAHSCCDVTLPDAFTPNGDGRNDKFRIITNGNQSIGRFIIVNRWGQKVFETNNPSDGWDGFYNGVPQEVGTYYYYIKYTCTDQKIFEKKGEVILVR